MKTVEEWFEQLNDQTYYGDLMCIAEDTIKQIQLDAYKAGMLKAVEIAESPAYLKMERVTLRITKKSRHR